MSASRSRGAESTMYGKVIYLHNVWWLCLKKLQSALRVRLLEPIEPFSSSSTALTRPA